MWTPLNKRSLPVALIALVLIGAMAGSAWAQAPRAERPSYAVGDKWIRSDGAYDLIRIENERYVFASDGGREIHLTAISAWPRSPAAAKTLLELEPPPALAWPLDVGQWGA